MDNEIEDTEFNATAPIKRGRGRPPGTKKDKKQATFRVAPQIPGGKFFPGTNLTNSPNPAIKTKHDPRYQIGDERGDLENDSEELAPIVKKFSQALSEKLSNRISPFLEKNSNECEDREKCDSQKAKEVSKKAKLESLVEKDIETQLIDSIDFLNGKNKLALKFVKTSNRIYKVEIELNDLFEIKPCTYNGTSGALTFWGLLKRSIT